MVTNQQTDYLIFSMDEAVDRFSFEFEDKIKPILFKQFYLASIKDSVFKIAIEIYNIKNNNPKLYKDNLHFCKQIQKNKQT